MESNRRGAQSVNRSDYRDSAREQLRTRDLMGLVPTSGDTALDVGARDGHFSLLLAQRFDRVIALDLDEPQVDHPRVRCVRGDAAELDLEDASMDFVLCAEVLEHVPEARSTKVCNEMARVCRDRLLVGVPYRQDTRVGRTTCPACHGINPPWGHLNSFDEGRLIGLFPGCRPRLTSYVGSTVERTNALSTRLMDWAGNPYGTYDQDEGCVHCGRALVEPPARSIPQKVLTKLAFYARDTMNLLATAQPNWIHMLFAKDGRR